jgi:hypothetical protein
MAELPGISSRVGDGLLFFGGLEIGYNVGGQTLSAPQTTELRVMGAEGGGAAVGTLFKWVHMATAKVFLYCAFVSILTRSYWPIVGGLVAIADTFASYSYAVKSGTQKAGGLEPDSAILTPAAKAENGRYA